jgi:hypothetical protein
MKYRLYRHTASTLKSHQPVEARLCLVTMLWSDEDHVMSIISLCHDGIGYLSTFIWILRSSHPFHAAHLGQLVPRTPRLSIEL